MKRLLSVFLVSLLFIFGIGSAEYITAGAEEPTVVIENANGTSYEESLEAAIDKAVDGDVLVLNGAFKLPPTHAYIKKAITFDLNGCTMSTSSFISFKAKIIDSSGGNGLLKVTDDRLHIPQNVQLPVWDGDDEGWRFADVKVNAAVGTDSAKLESFDSGYIYLITEPHFGETVNALFTDGGTDDNKIKIGIRLRWEDTSNDMVWTQECVYSDMDKIAAVYADGMYGTVLNFVATGLENYKNITAVPFVVSDSGIRCEAETVFEPEYPNVIAADAVQMKKWRDQTDERIEEILNTSNMELPTGRQVYYVSNNGNDMNDGKTPETAWKTLGKANSVSSNSIVCFERGGLWRGQLQAKENCIYTAYGEGEKPKLYASLKDYADPTLWTETDVENIWVCQVGTFDVGTLVFNHGENHAIKCVIRTEENGETFNNTTNEPFETYADLTTDLHFWHDYTDTGKVYLYSDKGNPGERFDSIEANINRNVIWINGDNVTIDNLCIKYTGAHGVASNTRTNLTVQNCEIGWIGGSIQTEEYIYGRNYATRYGNAVEIYGGCENFVVTGNYIYQVYDAAITQQYNNTSNSATRMDGMTYTKNVIEYSNYCIEYFLRIEDDDTASGMSDFLIAENLMWWPGVGLCEQRPDKDVATHVKAGLNGENPCDGYVIRDNLMVGAGAQMFHVVTLAEGSLPELKNNDLVAYEGNNFGFIVLQQTSTLKVYKFDESIPDHPSIQGTNNRIWFISE